MLKKTMGILALILILTTGPVMAGKKSAAPEVDFGALTCKEFMNIAETSSEDDLGALMLWLDGYLSGVSGDTVLNWKNFEDLATNLVTYCASNGRAKVIVAAKKVGIN